MKTIFTIAATACLLTAAGGCSRKNAAPPAPPAPVTVAVAWITNVPVFINPAPVGHVVPITTVNLRSQIGGLITEVHFAEGQEVKKGDLLFTIDPRPAQAALAQARATLQSNTAQMENARIQFGRDEKLFAQALISRDEYDTSRAAYEGLAGTVAANQAAVTNAELNLGYTTIRSPIDGRTGSLQAHAGNVVKSPDDILVTIHQVHPIYASFAVPEHYLAQIRAEMRDRTLPVSVTYRGLTGAPPRGELTFVDNAVDTNTATLLLQATFANPDGSLWPGQYVLAELQLSELTNVVVVPSQAVQTGQAGNYIFVIKADQTAEERPVTTGIEYDGKMVITSGLQAGETVVTDGQLRLTPGKQVIVRSSAATAPASAGTPATK